MSDALFFFNLNTVCLAHDLNTMAKGHLKMISLLFRDIK